VPRVGLLGRGVVEGVDGAGVLSPACSTDGALLASSYHQDSEHLRPAAPAGFCIMSYAPVPTSVTIRHACRTHSVHLAGVAR